MAGTQAAGPFTFHVILIKPSHYDDDGYVIQWARSVIPSNSLAVLYALAQDCAERRVLGDDVEILVRAIDESHTRVRPKKLAVETHGARSAAFVGLVGVQSNQYPRALDLARVFRDEGIPVCIGGFHVSGMLAMVPGVSPDLQEALDLGISLFAGEAEGRLDQVLRDAYRHELQPIYNWLHELPDLATAPMPYLPADCSERYALREMTFDAGRGCPFVCSFCTIINVQGRKSRTRDVREIERFVRQNAARGQRHYFITDDDFARNQNWEAIFDCFIRLREAEGLELNVLLQVDAMCHRIPGFIEKAARAGVRKVFIGIENLNPEALASARKKQNKVAEYRALLQQWRAVRVGTYAGYIVGFPNDTAEGLLRDVETLKRELPIETVEFNALTPLPGSEDHKHMVERGEWMEPDLNLYDLNHMTTRHPRMSSEEWRAAYAEAWKRYYSLEYIETVMYRARAGRMSVRRICRAMGHHAISVLIEGVHAPDSGLFRRKYRRERRPSMPRESPLVFYPRYAWEIVSKHLRIGWFYARCVRLAFAVEQDPTAAEYSDLAIAPIADPDPKAAIPPGQAPPTTAA